ncbi:uncharacterized protein V6R79_002155 [Siganus canaliculatus]
MANVPPLRLIHLAVYVHVISPERLVVDALSSPNAAYTFNIFSGLSTSSVKYKIITSTSGAPPLSVCALHMDSHGVFRYDCRKGFVKLAHVEQIINNQPSNLRDGLIIFTLIAAVLTADVKAPKGGSISCPSPTWPRDRVKGAGLEKILAFHPLKLISKRFHPLLHFKLRSAIAELLIIASAPTTRLIRAVNGRRGHF